MSDEVLDKPQDLTDPAVLAAECGVMAEGLDVQAESMTGRTAHTGHPYPEQLYRRTAAVLRAAAAFVAKHAPPPPAAPSGPPDAAAPPAAEPRTPEPAGPGGKKR